MSSSVQGILLLNLGMIPSSVGPPKFFNSFNSLCVVWRSRFLPQKKLIHIVPLVEEMGRNGKKWGSGSSRMMQSYVWDSFNHPLGFGSLVPAARQANRSICVPYPKRHAGQLQAFQSFHQSPCQTNSARCMPIEIMSATCIQTTQRHPTRFNTRTSQWANQAYMRLPAVSCACKLHRANINSSSTVVGALTIAC